MRRTGEADDVQRRPAEPEHDVDEAVLGDALAEAVVLDGRVSPQQDLLELLGLVVAVGRARKEPSRAARARSAGESGLAERRGRTRWARAA